MLVAGAQPGRVVPARAGIFPRGRTRSRRRVGRPRTRGDLPSAVCQEHEAEASSPHARGSSQPCLSPARTEGVVPARAGIFLMSCRRLPSRRSRPRTRGDLPGYPARRPTGIQSSPHARGSSPVPRGRHRDRDVVPARAGIFPRGTTRMASGGGRPRTRGDLPDAPWAEKTHVQSSPHARGSSHRAGTLAGRTRVVPARAGIFLGFGGPRRPARCRPRTRGDLPPVHGGAQYVQRSSPHARGSSPCGTRSEPESPSRPRTRGDLPDMGYMGAAPSGSSPHARGSSRRRRPPPTWRRVVPACAGIFPRAPRPGRARASRPRTRGDLPGLHSGKRVTLQSSPYAWGSSLDITTLPGDDLVVPHARGSSPLHRVIAVHRAVVSAGAGIFPRPGMREDCRACRPRMRGNLPANTRRPDPSERRDTQWSRRR